MPFSKIPIIARTFLVCEEEVILSLLIYSCCNIWRVSIQRFMNISLFSSLKIDTEKGQSDTVLKQNKQGENETKQRDISSVYRNNSSSFAVLITFGFAIAVFRSLMLINAHGSL